MSDEFLRVTFDHIIGRDVVRKLIQVSIFIWPCVKRFLNRRQKVGRVVTLDHDYHLILTNLMTNGSQVSDSVSLTSGYYLSSSSKDILHSQQNETVVGNEAEPMLTQMEEQPPEENGISGSFESEFNVCLI